MASATTWTPAEIERVASSTELDLASRRPDGSLRPFTTMWVAAVGDDLYVRSAGGPDRTWFQRAIASGRGRIRAGGIERDVRFSPPDHDIHAALDDAYHEKYDRYGPGPVGHVTGPDAVAVTLRLLPESPSERIDP